MEVECFSHSVLRVVGRTCLFLCLRDPKTPILNTSFGLPQYLPESLTISICFADGKLQRVFEVHLIGL